MKKVILFSLFILFLFSGLYMTNAFNGIYKYLIVLESWFLLSMLIVLKRKEIKINRYLFFTMTILFSVNTISSLINEDFAALVGSLGFYLVYLALSVMYYRLFSGNGLKVLYRLVLFSQIPLILSIIPAGINFPLRGIFYNPNSLGVTCATVYVTLLSYLLGDAEKSLLNGARIITKKSMFCFLLCVILLFITVGTQSRTSLITVFSFTLFSLFIFHLKGIFSKKYKIVFKTIFLMFIIPITSLGLYKFTFLEEYIYNNFIYKFTIQSNSSSMLSARDFIWRQTLNDAKLFGNGRDYFIDTLGIGAHNTFISMLGQYGWFSFIFFILFIVIAGFSGAKYSMKNKSSFKYLPLFSIGSFVLLSMGEGMLLTVTMLSMFCAISIISVSPHKQGNETVKVKNLIA